jgi:hypothetical protein
MQGVANKVDVTFQESKSSYTLVVYLVEKNTVTKLVDKIRKKGFISKESTLNKSMFQGIVIINVSESGCTGC